MLIDSFFVILSFINKNIGVTQLTGKGDFLSKPVRRTVSVQFWSQTDSTQFGNDSALDEVRLVMLNQCDYVTFCWTELVPGE